jgi:hypothetical protein
MTTTTSTPSSITIEPTETSSFESGSKNIETTKADTSNSSSIETTTTTAVPNGEVRALVGGVEVKSESTVAQGAVTVNVGEVMAEITNAEASDDPLKTQAEQGLVISLGGFADVAMKSMQPNSVVTVVIYSTPRKLGSLQVNKFGELFASIQIPKDMEAGAHTLVLTGLDQFGNTIELKFGLVMYSPKSYIPFWIWLLIGFLVLTLLTVLAMGREKNGTSVI